MKKAVIQDERVVAQKRKLGSDAFSILYFGLLVSILIQQFIFDAPFSQYAAEFILFMSAALYMVIGSLVVGNSIFDNSSGLKIVLINSLVCGLTIAAIAVTTNTMNEGIEKMGGLGGIAMIALFTFLIGALISFVGFRFLYTLNSRRQKQIDNRYSDKEE